MFLGVTAFFVVIGIVYWFASYEERGFGDAGGQRADGRRRRRLDLVPVAARAATRPRTSPTPTIADGAGPIDVFPMQSVWPFAVGLSARGVRERLRVRASGS